MCPLFFFCGVYLMYSIFCPYLNVHVVFFFPYKLIFLHRSICRQIECFFIYQFFENNLCINIQISLYTPWANFFLFRKNRLWAGGKQQNFQGTICSRIIYIFISSRSELFLIGRDHSDQIREKTRIRKPRQNTIKSNIFFNHRKTRIRLERIVLPPWSRFVFFSNPDLIL